MLLLHTLLDSFPISPLQMAEKRFNLLFGLASGTIRPDESFNVIQQPGVAQFTNPYVREYMSRYYPHHMNQLRMQYQQYAYQYARQMVRRPAYYQPGMMQQQLRQQQLGAHGYERDSFEGEEHHSEVAPCATPTPLLF